MLSQEGVTPDVIVCRTEEPLSPEIRKKIALFCNVKVEAVIEAADASTIYEVPGNNDEGETGPDLFEKTEYYQLPGC